MTDRFEQQGTDEASHLYLGDATEPPRDERRPLELHGYIVRASKEIVDVKVSDLSYDGCAIESLVPLEPGEKVKLSVLGRGATSAVVRWYSARKAGLRFRAERAPSMLWPRKAERVAVEAEISLRRSARLTYRVAIVDVTRFGCKCEFVERPVIYEHLWVKFEGLQSIAAIVCWIEESTLGLMFERPFHPAVFEMLLARMHR